MNVSDLNVESDPKIFEDRFARSPVGDGLLLTLRKIPSVNFLE
jgi:hypothetical protein